MSSVPRRSSAQQGALSQTDFKIADSPQIEILIHVLWEDRGSNSRVLMIVASDLGRFKGFEGSESRVSSDAAPLCIESGAPY